ncbi:MAG TPA: TIM barrel protein [Alphaproteobacteria bacterium]|nr:TIM barrel protein [Alphaproteobacteria bacterium]
MPRFCANISMLFTELPMVERPAAARAAGFEAIEVQFPYIVPLDDFAKAVEKAGVKVALINFPAGDFDKGDRGLGALPSRKAEFRAGVADGRRYAERLRVDRFNLLAGIPGPGVPDRDARAALIDNLHFAAEAVKDIGATVCLEAINTRDVPGFYLHDPDQAVALIVESGVRNAALQYDLYHMQIMRGDLIPTMERLMPRIGHIQFADTPGRHEPGTGEINYANVFAAIDRIGYPGWVGAEYKPAVSTLEGLGWFAAWRAGAAGSKVPA